jgi:hypothetical protein
MVSSLLFAFWSPAMMNTLFPCYILFWGNGLLLWWLHHKLVLVFRAMMMSYLCTVYISSFFYMTNEAMLMSYDDSSLVLNLSAMSMTEAMIMSNANFIFSISFDLFHDNWGEGQLFLYFFHLFIPILFSVVCRYRWEVVFIATHYAAAITSYEILAPDDVACDDFLLCLFW